MSKQTPQCSVPPPIQQEANMMTILPKTYDALKIFCATEIGNPNKCIEIIKARMGNDVVIQKYNKCRQVMTNRKIVCSELAMYGQFTSLYLKQSGFLW
jgi:hypothetical protein